MSFAAVQKHVADLRSFAADSPTSMQILSDTQVRVSRVIHGSMEQFWTAHHDPELEQETVNELTLTQLDEGTLVVLVFTHPSIEFGRHWPGNDHD